MKNPPIFDDSHSRGPHHPQGEAVVSSGPTADWCAKLWDTYLDYALHPNKVPGEDATVYRTYCFNGSASHSTLCIYYATNRGDYVLYANIHESPDYPPYLLPALAKGAKLPEPKKHPGTPVFWGCLGALIFR